MNKYHTRSPKIKRNHEKRKKGNGHNITHRWRVVEKIENDVHSYIDDNLKDKIEDYYNKHSKKTRNKKSNLDEVELTERCWKGYTQKGMKTMFGKKYPNCVKIKK